MRCIRCGREHNETYGQRCEDCWALGQAAIGIAGIPGLSGLSGNHRPIKESVPNHPDFAAMLRGEIVVIA